MAHAEDTWWEGNQVAASCEGIPKMKIWAMATIVWPKNRSGNSVWSVAKTLIQRPRQVPTDPSRTQSRKPWNNQDEKTFTFCARDGKVVGSWPRRLWVRIPLPVDFLIQKKICEVVLFNTSVYLMPVPLMTWHHQCDPEVVLEWFK